MMVTHFDGVKDTSQKLQVSTILYLHTQAIVWWCTSLQVCQINWGSKIILLSIAFALMMKHGAALIRILNVSQNDQFSHLAAGVET